MAAKRAGTTYDKQKNPESTRQMSQAQTYGQRQPEHVSESSLPLHRYLGNNYVQARAVKGDTAQQESAQPVVQEVLRSPGQPLGVSIRSSMEPLFVADFSKVRVHTDLRAAESAQAVNALAYTVGHHIVFGADKYAPSSQNGRGLLAHELAHTIQQRNASGAPPSADPHGIFESSADAAGREVATGQVVSGELPASGPGLSRAPAPPTRTAFSGDKRMRTWRRYAEEEARRDAARIRKSGKLSAEDREEVNAKLGFFEGKAKEIYIREIRPTLLAAEEAERREREAIRAYYTSTRQAVLDRQAAEEARRREREGMLAYYTSTRQAALDLVAAEREKRREEIYNLPPGQIQSQWEARRDEFISVAQLPDHRLTRQQLFWIWLSYWAERDAAVRRSFAQLRHVKPEYRLAAEEAAEKEEAMVRLMLRTSYSVNVFLIGAEGRRHLTLEQLNQEALKLASFHENLVMATGMILPGGGMTGGTRSVRLPALPKPPAAPKAQPPVPAPAPVAPVPPPTAPAPARPVTPTVATGRSVSPPTGVKPTPPPQPARPTTETRAEAVVAPTPTKPAPVQPIRPKGLRAWRRAAKLKHVIEGVEVSGAAPGIGAGGATTASTRPTPAVIVKTKPQPPAPTPDLPPSMPTPPRAVSPAKIVTPSAPGRPSTTGGAIGTPAPVKTTPSLAPVRPPTEAPGRTIVAPTPAPTLTVKPGGGQGSGTPTGMLRDIDAFSRGVQVPASHPVFKNKQPANKNAPPENIAQQQVVERAGTGTTGSVGLKVIQSSGPQQDASRLRIVASGERETPSRETPTPTPAPAQPPSRRRSSPPQTREFDDSPTDPEALPFGASQAQQVSPNVISRPRPARRSRTSPFLFGRGEDGYIQDGIFRAWLPHAIPSEGWKLHVSAAPGTSLQGANLVLPRLREMGVAHKVVESPVALETQMTGKQQGKFITIYPRSDAEARSIVSALDPLLSGGRLSGPVITGERSLGSSGLIYTRYGGFTKPTVTHPSGREVPDNFRGTERPPWIPDLWGGGGPQTR
jgi:hypothetical protein